MSQISKPQGSQSACIHSGSPALIYCPNSRILPVLQQDCSPCRRSLTQRNIPSKTSYPYLPAHSDQEIASDSVTLIKHTGPILVFLPSLSNTLQRGLIQLPSLPATWERKFSSVRRNLLGLVGCYQSIMHRCGILGSDFQILVLISNSPMFH